MSTLPPSLPLSRPSKGFEHAAASVLSFVRAELELDMALVSRRVDTHYVVLAAEDARWGTNEGDVLVWGETLCAATIDGRAPMIVPCIDDVPALVQVRARQGADMQSYVSVPIRDRDGEITGTLCGAGTEAKGEDFAAKITVVQLLADLLGSLLQHERDLAAATRAAERAMSYAHTDALTGLANRRHWESTLVTEAERFRRYANPFSVVIFEVDDLEDVYARQGQVAGDELTSLAAEILTVSVRPSDTVARLGGGEFGILAVECDRDGASALTARLTSAFAAIGMRPSIGAAASKPGQDARATWTAAEALMNASKRALGSLVDLL